MRPYIPISGVLMRKMIDGKSCANACRDARLVRTTKQTHVWSSILLERTHGPCVPTYLYRAYCAARRVIVGSDVVHLENLLHGMRQESGDSRHVFRGKFVTLHMTYR